MGWVSLALALAKLLNLVMGYVNNRQLMDAGGAENVVKAIEQVNLEVEKARSTISLIRTDPKWAERLRQLADRDK